MRILAMLALVSSLVVYVLALFVKMNVFVLWNIKPISLVEIAGVNAIIAIAFGVLSQGKK
jgi:hypothetical protein